jgi:hypothetical protein
MSTMHVGPLALVEPACQVEVGMRTPAQQEACVQTEVGVNQIAVGLLAIVTLAAARTRRLTIENGCLEVEEAEPSWKRAAMAAGAVVALGLICVKIQKNFRMRQWRAQTYAVANALTKPAEAAYIQHRISAESLEGAWGKKTSE